MAKFSGKNIEFKDGQKAIFGNNDDSAIYWDTVADQLVISTVVSGVDPTAAGHLITKRYLEDVLTGTTESGIDQIGNILFGSEFIYEIDNTESSTNATTYQNKLTITTTAIPEGNYRLGLHFEWKISKNNASFYYRIRQDDTTTLDEIGRPTFNDVNIYNPLNNFYYLETVASGTHHFDIEYRTASSSATAYIRNARLEFWRVS
jgi:hypothetical protein